MSESWSPWGAGNAVHLLWKNVTRAVFLAHFQTLYHVCMLIPERHKNIASIEFCHKPAGYVHVYKELGTNKHDYEFRPAVTSFRHGLVSWCHHCRNECASFVKLMKSDMLHTLFPPWMCYLILLCKLFFTWVMDVHFNKRSLLRFNCDICVMITRRFKAFFLGSLWPWSLHNPNSEQNPAEMMIQ